MADANWMDNIFELVRRIPRGKVCTYGILAEKAGARLSSRMVGWAMNASHRVHPPVPAHRVVNRIGMLTGKHHFATPTLMQELLQAEGVNVVDDRIVNFQSHLHTFADEC